MMKNQINNRKPRVSVNFNAILQELFGLDILRKELVVLFIILFGFTRSNNFYLQNYFTRSRNDFKTLLCSVQILSPIHQFMCIPKLIPTYYQIHSNSTN